MVSAIRQIADKRQQITKSIIYKMSFRLDKTAFKKVSHMDSGNDRTYWLSKTPMERFEAAWYLISQTYGFDLENPPPMDKRLFSARKHEVR